MTTADATVRATTRPPRTPTGGPPTRAAAVLRWAIPIFLIVVWEVAARGGQRMLVPVPSRIIESTWDLLVSGELLDLLIVSNQSLILGTAAALLLGIPLGILLGRSATLDRFLNVFITISLATPTVALLPLIIVLFGLGPPARIFFVFLISFDTVVSMVRTGVRRVDPTLLEMADCFAARWYHTWPKVILPGMVPTVAGAVRVAISRGLIGMVIIELTLISVGIGGFIMRQRVFFRPNDVFAGVLILCVEAVLLSLVARKLEQRLAPRGIYGTGGRSE